MMTVVGVDDVSGDRLGGVINQECGVGADVVERYQPVLGGVTNGTRQLFVEMANS
jgi:hypothetical protein